MKTKTILLCTVALSLGSFSAQAENNTSNSGPRYTPRPDIYQNNYTEQRRIEDHMDTISYNAYEQREPCQNYRKPPRNYSDGCVSNMMKKEVVPVTTTRYVPVKPKATKNVLPIISTYTVLFDFDKSNIRAAENVTLDRAVNEIDKYDPKQITVTGYTDSSGDAAYNQTLSREREQAVSKALLTRSIENYTLDREARGEYEQAVQTADGVKNQDNRRVIIDFRR